MEALLRRQAEAQFRYWGGNKMKAVGGTLVKHYKELAFMGFWEVVKNLRTIFRNLDACFQDIQNYRPDILILVDYSGFNLRIAEKAKKAGIKVHYYISPQVWASRSSRVKKIKAFVDEMYVILPFEKAFYASFNYKVNYIGHPLLDVVKSYKSEATNTPLPSQTQAKEKVIALLPGSRKQEIKMMLGEMLQVVPHFPDYRFVIAGAPSMEDSFYRQILEGFPKEIQEAVRLVKNKTYDLFNSAEAALVTSGTATLEAALFQVPQVVCYKGGVISFAIAKRIIQVKYISLVNLIMDKEVVKELIQGEMTAANLKTELRKILQAEKQFELKEVYSDLANRLGNEGAPDRAAAIISQSVRSLPRQSKV